jgi:hypothetical protein
VPAEVDPLHPLELGERSQRDPDVQFVGELRPDPAGGAARRAGPERLPFQEHDVVDAELAQVPCDARTHGAAAHDHNVVCLHPRRRHPNRGL